MSQRKKMSSKCPLADTDCKVHYSQHEWLNSKCEWQQWNFVIGQHFAHISSQNNTFQLKVHSQFDDG